MMGVEKQAIRTEIRARRKALSADIVEAAGVAVCRQLSELAPYRDAASLAAYVACENEVPTAAVLDTAAAAQRPLYLPRMSSPPAFVRWHAGQPLTRLRNGISEPPADAADASSVPAVALLPLVGWDRHGTRLGRGGGFYDRLLAGLDPMPVCIGLAYEFQEVPDLPRDAWDVPLQFVITERRVVRCVAAADPDAFQKGGLQ